jgi:phosphatidylserine/phosphatidylglycerophosphate/cardiolipin synthase-like enzyme
MLGQVLRSTFLKQKAPASELLSSSLLNEETFYPALMKDLSNCGSELIIESPFVTNRRLNQLLPTLQKLKQRKVRIIINTRDPHEHDEERRRDEAHRALAKLQREGVQVLYTGGHHRKLVVIDRKVLYEGSLNVLSQNNSSEIMRRIESIPLAWQVIRFTGLDNYF